MSNGRIEAPLNHLTAPTVRRLMAVHRRTISRIAQEHGLTDSRVRQVREQGVTGVVFAMDWMEILTGDPYAGWEVVADAYLGAARRPMP